MKNEIKERKKKKKKKEKIREKRTITLALIPRYRAFIHSKDPPIQTGPVIQKDYHHNKACTHYLISICCTDVKYLTKSESN